MQQPRDHEPEERAEGETREADAERESGEDNKAYLWPRAVIMVGLIAATLIAVSLGLEPLPDRGVRVWLLNHAPDQIMVMDPDVMGFKASFGVADGLQEIAFSGGGENAYIASVVDVKNEISVVDTETYQTADKIVTSGIPQGVEVLNQNPQRRRTTVQVANENGELEDREILVPPYPGDRYVAYIPGSRTKFEAAGFTVLDMNQRAPGAPNQYRSACRIRANRLDLLNDIESSPNGRYIYAVAAKSSNIFVYDFWRCLNGLPPRPEQIDIDHAIFGMHIPENGPYIYAAAIKTKMIYVIDRETNEIVRYLRHPDDFFGRFRHMVTDESGKIVYATVRERSELLKINAETGELLKSKRLPVKIDLIEMSPYYDELYVVGSGEGNIYRVKLPSFEVSDPLRPRGDFRDIAVKPIPDSRMLSEEQLDMLEAGRS